MQKKDKIKNILIVTGGSADIKFAAGYLQGSVFDKIIAADAGLRVCRALGLTPTDILGDFDSLKSKELLKEYEEQGVPIQKFSARKDYTDTHLAVEYAIDLSPERVILFGATGSRLDHTLANIGMLEKLEKAGIRGKIVDKNNEIEMLCGANERKYEKLPERKFFSLMAWGGKATGIDLTGFAYPLSNAKLLPSHSVGISNELEKDWGIVKIKTGNLLVIRSND